jgi:putative membrane protein
MKKTAWVIGIVLGVLALAALVLLIVAGFWMGGRAGFMPHMTRGWSGMPWGGMHAFGGGLVLLVLLGLIGGAVALLLTGTARRKERTGDRTAEDEPARLDILKRRYASGEVTREEYERIREDLLR